ncbi:Inositolphosphotransferase Aur1/Ipt1 [Paracoccaceae bacterium]
MSNQERTQLLARQVRTHAVLAIIVAIYAAISFTLHYAESDQNSSAKFAVVFASFALMIPQMIFLVLFWRLLQLTYVQRSPDRMAALKTEVWSFVTDRDRMLGGFIAAVLMTMVLVSFAQLKNLLPVLNPFSWDADFSELDRVLHFGTLPHEFLDAVFGAHYSLSFFTGIYNLWLFLMYFVLVIACFLRTDNPHRIRYLIAFILTWSIGGNLLATLFSSAGPPYFANLGLGSTYEPLMQVLKAHALTGALTVVDTQALLWRWHISGQQINAISAFPSMHVASSVLMAIVAFQFSRLLGVLMSLFAMGIMIGSVLLGWHYAVDGYAGGLVAALSWIAAGWLVQRTSLPNQSQVSSG